MALTWRHNLNATQNFFFVNDNGRQYFKVKWTLIIKHVWGWKLEAVRTLITIHLFGN